MRPARMAADSFRLLFNNPFNPFTHTPAGRNAAAAFEMFERTTRRYVKPEFGLHTALVDGADVEVREEVVWQRPFCRLIHFKRDIAPERAERHPRILLVAPIAGHFATLLRGTVEALLGDHEVFITDWQDARDIAPSAGSFDLDDYIDYLREMLRHLGGDVHVLAICQAAVPALAALALMEEDGETAVPASLILAGGPVDCRISPTIVNELAEQNATQWFRSNVITTVPWPNAGAGRHVYPGFLQLSGFMSMNLDRHAKAHKDLFMHLVEGNGDAAEKNRDFYDEYLAVMDLTAEFYLQTIDTVFVRHALAKGEMVHRGRRIDLGAIRRVPLMTIEGEKDDITGAGQCRAALALCSGVPQAKKVHFECPSVGHYGIFNGSRYRVYIAPRIAHFVRSHDKRASLIPAVQLLDCVTDARSVHHAYDVSSVAFTFAPANDTAPVASTQRHSPHETAD